MNNSALILLLQIDRGDFNEQILPYSPEASFLDKDDCIEVDDESYPVITGRGREIVISVREAGDSTLKLSKESHG